MRLKVPRYLLMDVVFLCAIACIFLLYQTRQPIFFGTTVLINNEKQAGSMPYKAPTNTTSFTIQTNMHLPRFHANIYTIIPDDCLEEFTINGTVVPMDPQLCWGATHIVNLKRYLHAGDNSLEATIKDNGGFARFGIQLAPFNDPALIAVNIILALSILLYGYRRFPGNKSPFAHPAA